MSRFSIDSYVKIVLTVIALSLAILAGKAVIGTLIPEAQAQRTTQNPEPPAKQLDAKVIRKFEAPGVQEIVVLGDQKTFVVKQKDQVSVVRVDFFDVK